MLLIAPVAAGDTPRSRRSEHRSAASDFAAYRDAVVSAPEAPAQPDPCQFCAEPDADTDATLPMMLFGVAIGLVAWGVFGWTVVTLIEAARGVL
jgi:hypothetical protein